MWILRNSSTGECFYMPGVVGKIYSVGRSETDLVLRDDMSVSRNHAIFKCQNKSHHELWMEDKDSLHGTYVNDQISSDTRLEKGERVKLKDGDVIRFGKLQNIWDLEHKSFTTAMSMLLPADVSQTEDLVRYLGGKVVPNWDAKCTHLTMNEIVATIKVLHALLEEKPIVTVKYWQDCVKAVQNHRKLPKPENYMPSFNEKLFTDLKRNSVNRSKRKTLFAGLKFVFLSLKQSELYGPIVEKAGATYQDITKGIEKRDLINKNTVVIEFGSSHTRNSKSIHSYLEYLTSHSRRAIPEYEIGMAIINCSAEKFCNPAYKIMSNLLPPAEPVKDKSNNILVENTDIINNSQSFDPHVHIPETRISGQNTMKLEMGMSEALAEELLLAVSETDDEDEALPNNKNNKNNNSTPMTLGTAMRKRKKSFEGKSPNEKIVKQPKRHHFDLEALLKPDKSRKLLQQEAAKFFANQTHKKTPSPVMPKVKPPPTYKPTSVIFLPKDLSDTGYLTKLQPKQKVSKASTPPKSKSPNAENNDKKKKARARISVLTNDDDDLFDFSSSHKAKKSRNIAIIDEDPDEEIFGHFSQSKNTKPQSKVPVKNFVIPKPRTIPDKINIDGWLTTIKRELFSKDEKLIQSGANGERTKERKWWENLKGGFEIRNTAVNKTFRCKNIKNHDQSGKNEINFKRFKKQKVLRPGGTIKARPCPVV